MEYRIRIAIRLLVRSIVMRQIEIVKFVMTLKL